MKKTRKHNPAFKAKVALAALRPGVPRLRAATRSTPTWSTSGSGCSGQRRRVRDGPRRREDVLLKKIGELTMERDQDSGDPDDAATSPDCAERHAVDASASMLAVTRSSMYYDRWPRTRRNR